MGHSQVSQLKTIQKLALEEQIEALLLDQVKKAQARNPFKGPTVGLEQEFFVFKADGATPASLLETQGFLQTLSQCDGWKIKSSREYAGKAILTRVSYEHENARYSAVKYEFPPHLLEMAFTYYDDVCVLQEDVTSRWNDLETTATKCGLKIVLKPFISPPSLNLEDQIVVDSKLSALAESRRSFLVRRGEPVDMSVVDFPSFMAATQTQVGIPFAWGNEKFMHRLYALELSILPLLNASPSMVGKRQALYDYVFRGLKLLGIPELKAWTLKGWIKAICDSPLTSSRNERVDILRTVWRSGDQSELASLLTQARDLQIIRPKAIGTIEFRGDGSVTSPSQMIRLVAIRFAAALLAADANTLIPNEELSFGEIRKEWLSRIYSENWSETQLKQASDIHQEMLKLLERRGRSEEKFLSPVV